MAEPPVCPLVDDDKVQPLGWRPRVRVELVGFADALVSFGCSLRDRFQHMFSDVWVRLPRPPAVEMNFTAAFRFMREKLRVPPTLFQMQVDAPELFSSDDEPDFFGPQRGGTRFLNKYSVSDLTDMVSASKMGPDLASHGIDDWYIALDLHDSLVHSLYLLRRSDSDRSRAVGLMVVQLRVDSDLDLLNVRWLALQDPRADFSAHRPRLPGQRYPGSGLARSAFQVVSLAAQRAGRDGILNRPEHFHNALFYRDEAKLGSDRSFRFMDPGDEGWFVRLSRDLEGDIGRRGLAAVSWAIYLGFLRCGEEQARWTPKDQVYPISPRMVCRFSSSEYVRGVEAARGAAGPFRIRWEEAEKLCLEAIIELGHLRETEAAG